MAFGAKMAKGCVQDATPAGTAKIAGFPVRFQGLVCLELDRGSLRDGAVGELLPIFGLDPGRSFEPS